MLDIISFNDELDQLEIRLNELNPVVDTFLIIESEQAFSRKPKPLYYHTNKHRFQDFQSKIVHIVPPSMSNDERSRIRGWTYPRPGWQEEVFERSKGIQLTFEMGQPQEGDWFIVSDLDEIPRKEAILALHGADSTDSDERMYFSGANKDIRNVIPLGKDIYRFECQFFEFSYEYRIDSAPWFGPIAFRYWVQDNNILHRLLLHTNRRQSLEANATQQEKAIQKLFNKMAPPKGTIEFQNTIDHNNRTSDELHLYNEAWRKNWQDGRFRLRWFRIRKEIALLNDAC